MIEKVQQRSLPLTPLLWVSYLARFSVRVQRGSFDSQALQPPLLLLTERKRERRGGDFIPSLNQPSFFPLLFWAFFFFFQDFSAAQSGSMPAVFILLQSLVIRLLSSRLVGSVAQYLRRILSTGATHLGTALRHIWDRVRSQESKEAILGCVLCILNMHKKVENWALSLPLSTFGSTLHLTAELRLDNCLVRRAHKGMKQTFFQSSFGPKQFCFVFVFLLGH